MEEVTRMLDEGLLDAIRNLRPFARLVKPPREPIRVTETFKLEGDLEAFFAELGKTYDLKAAGIEVVLNRAGQRAVYITRYVL